MNTLTPMSRDSMKSLKRECEELFRLQQIDTIVRKIYIQATMVARETTSQTCTYKLPLLTSYYSSNPEFHRTNMADIISSLQAVFPECQIKNLQYTIGAKERIVYTPLSDRSESNECIVIDWS